LPPNFEDVRNQAKFCMFLAPEIFLGCAPEILEWHYKIGPSTDHRAKFHASWPTHLRDLARTKKNKNKTSGLKHKPTPQAIAFGRTKYNSSSVAVQDEKATLPCETSAFV